MSRLALELKGLLDRVFHDDVPIVARDEALRDIMATAARLGATVDSILSPSKCYAWSPALGLLTDGLLPQWRPRGIVQISMPLGDSAFVAERVAAMAADVAVGASAVTPLPPEEVQTKLLLLRHCVGWRVNYARRCLRPEKSSSLAAAADGAAQRALADRLVTPEDSAAEVDALHTRATPPALASGFGLGYWSRVAAETYTASWADALVAGPEFSPALTAVAAQLRATPCSTRPPSPPPPPSTP